MKVKISEEDYSYLGANLIEHMYELLAKNGAGATLNLHHDHMKALTTFVESKSEHWKP
jgi:hypothetical protein